MKKLVIKRSSWLRGEGGDTSTLFRPRDGKMCCLGFYLRDQGIEEDELIDMPDPQSLNCDLLEAGGEIPDWLLSGKDNSALVVELISINDLIGDPEETREAEIKEAFARADVEVTFED